MDHETKKAAEFCRIPCVGHIVSDKPPLRPLVRYRTSERLPDGPGPVHTDNGLDNWLPKRGIWLNACCYGTPIPTWWAYLPEGDE